MTIDFEKDAEALAIGTDSLTEIGELARQALSIEREIADLEEVVKERKAVLTELTEHRIPEALREVNMTSFKMADGSMWKPKNYQNRFFGPSTLRRGIEHTRNGTPALLEFITSKETAVSRL